MRGSAGCVVLLGLLACGRPAPGRAGPGTPGVRADSSRTALPPDSLAFGSGSLPRLATDVLALPAFSTRYTVFAGLNPYFQRGHFDADTIPDVAVQIREIASGKRGIAIIHGGDATVHILGAGSPFGNGGDDFGWLWIWRVEPRGVLAEATPVGREVLYVEQPEAAGGFIWWNGRAYVWTQAGD